MIFFLVAIVLFLTGKDCFADEAIIHFIKGNKYSREQKFQQAITEYKKAISINPKIADFHYNMANVLVAIEKDQEAIKEYNIAISLNPLDTDIHRNLGIAYVYSGNLKKAEEILQFLKKAGPDKAKQLESFFNTANKK